MSWCRYATDRPATPATTVYVCRDRACRLPVQSVAALGQLARHER